MPDNQPGDNGGAAAHERFVSDSWEMNLAWADGRLDEWLQEKLADERIAAGIESTA